MSRERYLTRVSKEQEGHLRTFRNGRHRFHLLKYTVHLFSLAGGQKPVLLTLLGLESCRPRFRSWSSSFPTAEIPDIHAIELLLTIK